MSEELLAKWDNACAEKDDLRRFEKKQDVFFGFMLDTEKRLSSIETDRKSCNSNHEARIRAVEDSQKGYRSGFKVATLIVSALWAGLLAWLQFHTKKG